MAFPNYQQRIVLQPQNCLDSQASTILQQQLAAIAPDRHKLWVIDMSDVDFIDSFRALRLSRRTQYRPPAGMSPRHL
ncbi:MAG: STAS domain-containing protein [Microcoleus sp.]